MKNSQLIKRNHIAGGYTKVYPIAYIQGITDGVTGEHLTDILQSFSHIYLPYEGSAKDTRTSLPDDYRRQGIWITYNSGDSIITEIYKGTADDLHNDVLFGEDVNWERVPDLKYVQSNASKIPDGAILPEMLSPAILQLLSNGNTIYNVVDDEDLESNECNVIKFKDRVYNKELASGKGYKILRKNWVDGKNILTQDMIANTNTIYEIRYDFDLNGAEITIPEGCVLKFNGGSLSNGVLIGNNTQIEAQPIYIFIDIKFLGTYSISISYAEWFGAKGDGIADDINAINLALKFSRVLRLLIGKSYKITSSILMNYKNSIIGDYNSEIVADGDFDIIKVGYKCTVADLSFNLSKPMCVISIDANYISETFDAGFVGKDAYRYKTSVGINIKNIDVFSPCDDSIDIADNIYCIKCIANGFGTGFWQVNIQAVNIIGKYEYGIYINSGIALNGTVKTWQTDQSYQDIKMLYCKNGIYVGKDDENLEIGGFPPERIVFDRVSMQCMKYSERFAFVNAGNRIIFINCEPWDWHSVQKPFLINPDKTSGVSLDKCSNLSDASRFDLTSTSETISLLSNIPSEIGIGNSPVKGSYDLSHFFDTERINQGTRITKGEVKSLPSGNYLIPASTKWNVFLGITAQYGASLELGQSLLTIEKGRNNSNLLILYPMYSPMSSKRGHYYYAPLYLVLPNNAPEENNDPIPDFIEIQPKIQTYNNVDEFLQTNFYKFYFSGWVKGNNNYPKFTYKINDTLALDALGYPLTDNYGSERPTDLGQWSKGKQFFDTNLKNVIFWDGTKWIDSNGNPADAKNYGSFAEKPLSSTGIKVGFQYLATDVRNANAIKGMIIYHKGNNIWIAPDGTPVTSVTSLAKDAILFNSVINDTILGASTAGTGTPENVYYSSHLKCFVLKKDNAYYNNFDNVADWNDDTEEFTPKPYANKYYISKNNDRYKWNNTNLVINEE